MSRAASLGRLEAIHTCFVIDLERVGLRAAARRQAADDHFRLCIFEALRDVIQILALGSCRSSAVERQRALRPRDGRGRVAPSDTLSDNSLANITRGPYNSDALVRLIYSGRESHAHCRGAQRGRRARQGGEEEEACHLYNFTPWLACGVLRGALQGLRSR